MAEKPGSRSKEREWARVWVREEGEGSEANHKGESLGEVEREVASWWVKQVEREQGVMGGGRVKGGWEEGSREKGEVGEEWMTQKGESEGSHEEEKREEEEEKGGWSRGMGSQ
ncbi:unnamed protein product, partial [Closterium sp. NIES-53]